MPSVCPASWLIIRQRSLIISLSVIRTLRHLDIPGSLLASRVPQTFARHPEWRDILDYLRKHSLLSTRHCIFEKTGLEEVGVINLFVHVGVVLSCGQITIHHHSVPMLAYQAWLAKAPAVKRVNLLGWDDYASLDPSDEELPSDADDEDSDPDHEQHQPRSTMGEWSEFLKEELEAQVKGQRSEWDAGGVVRWVSREDLVLLRAGLACR